MLWYLCGLIAVLVTSTHGYSANKTYPTFAKCNPHTITPIKALWRLGKTPDVLKKIEQHGLFTFYGTTYDYFNSENKCNYIKVENGTFSVMFAPKTGDEPAVLKYKVEEGEDGVIRGRPLENDTPEHRFNFYPITFKHGVALCYVCSDIEGSKETPIYTIMVANRHKSPLSTLSINNGHSFLQNLGINFKYNYGPECNVN